MAKDIIDIAIRELGYAEQGNNRTKYGAWMGMDGAAWCHMFVSWCADQAGESAAVPKTASTSSGMQWFMNKGLFKNKGQYTPKRGDVVYFKTGRSHVGLVEYVSGNTLHTVEGNSSNKVARRTYSLFEKTITGYGVPRYKNLNTKSSGSTGSSSSQKESNQGAKEELAYLKRVLEKKQAKPETVSGEVKETNKLPDGIVDILVTNGKNQFFVPAEDGMQIVWERQGTPGKLTFSAKYDKKFKLVEGNSVLVSVDGTKFFYGFIFKHSMSKDGMVSYTAYDQLRYLKNKDNVFYVKKRADQVVRQIAKKFNLQTGTLANTGYIIPKRMDDNTELFDAIQNALDATAMVKGKIYVLYDKIGKLTLTDVSKMKVNTCLVDEETGRDFTYEISIDDEVYNQIKLMYENKETGKYDIYIAKNSEKINQWGVLQYTDKIDDPDIGKLKSQALLKLYCKKKRTLSVSGVIGNKNVRAGSLVPVMLKVHELNISNYMLVEKVTHTFKNREWTMDLLVSGGDFSV
ncbi:MAG: CHAP domain-containing protein [Ruminococcus flavefaciens]|nr:CHAP domain-containing protein [Ruminococcus flavefaciens]